MLPPTHANRPWDFIYLDTTHQYEQTRNELICLTQLCTPETVFCAHDSSVRAAYELDLKQQGGVNRALAEWVTHHREWSCFVFEEPAFGHFGMAVMQRKA
jgi:hypothetical protein